MSICKLMICDFMIGTGRLIKGARGFTKAYTDQDLINGIGYAEWLIEMGYDHEPFYGFGLEEFMRWAQSKLIG
jgi:hypothetical protein